MAPGPSIIIGIDFGTTFSGVAWALEGSIDEAEVLKSWPGGGNKTSLKVPSIISYDDETVHWGYQVSPYSKAFRGIKLLLDESQETRYVHSLASKLLLDVYQKDAVQVTGDYLRKLVDHVKQVLQRRLGIIWEEMNINFILTVPAVWSDKAKDGTLRAAIKANIPARNISLVSEPEAAALYTLRSIQSSSINDMSSSYAMPAEGRWTSSRTKSSRESLFVSQKWPKALVAFADRCFWIIRFEAFLRDKMGDLYSALSHKSREITLSYWQDRVKPGFTGKLDDEFGDVDYFVPIPGVPDDPTIPIEDGFLQLSSDDIEDIFEPIVEDVEKLIAQQMSKINKLEFSTKAILLVGGFGSSEYLFRRIQEVYPKLEILQPPNAWSAVVSGAVQRGLDGNRVESRIARRHYGIVYRTDFNPRIHNYKESTWSSLEEKYVVDDRVRWYIQKGSKLCENVPIRFPFFRVVKVRDTDYLVFKDSIHFCNDEHAPGVRNGRTMKLCTLEADLREVPRDLFEMHRNSEGVKYFKINYNLVMIPTSASLLFELEFQGVSYGIVRSRY